MPDPTVQELIAGIKAYVDGQLLQCQINYMDYMAQGEEGLPLANNEKAVMDKLYEFANLFWNAEIPAPGQGYEPPAAVWGDITKERELEEIDTAMADLLRRREQVAGRARPQPPVEPEPVDPGDGD